MKEKNIQTLFGQQIREIGIDGIFELKLTKGKSIRWDSVKDHQIRALERASGKGGLYHKIQDSPVSWTTNEPENPILFSDAISDPAYPKSKRKKSRFTLPKPFDCFFFRNTPAYVVICWYVPRKRKTLHFIRIEDYVRNMDRAERKSFREDESVEMASRIHGLRG